MRYVGIQHRVKRSAAGEARPTKVAILAGDAVRRYDLESEQGELDFVKGVFPTAFRDIQDGEDLTTFRPHQVKWRKLKDNERPEQFAANRVRKDGKTWYIAHRVPVRFDGLAGNDQVAMMLGGSGDYLAFALKKRGEQVGATVFRIPPFVFDQERTGADKDQDAALLAQLLQRRPEHFYKVTEMVTKLI